MIEGSAYPCVFRNGDISYRNENYNITHAYTSTPVFNFRVIKENGELPASQPAYDYRDNDWSGSRGGVKVLQAYIRKLSIEQGLRESERESERRAGVGRTARRGRWARVPVVDITLSDVQNWSEEIPEITYSGLSGFTSVRARSGKMATWEFRIVYLYENGLNNPPTTVKFTIIDTITDNEFAIMIYKIQHRSWEGFWTGWENDTEKVAEATQLILRYLTQLIEKDAREGRQVRII
jgi:hypothetical protein